MKNANNIGSTRHSGARPTGTEKPVHRWQDLTDVKTDHEILRHPAHKIYPVIDSCHLDQSIRPRTETTILERETCRVYDSQFCCWHKINWTKGGPRVGKEMVTPSEGSCVHCEAKFVYEGGKLVEYDATAGRDLREIRA